MNRTVNEPEANATGPEHADAGEERTTPRQVQHPKQEPDTTPVHGHAAQDLPDEHVDGKRVHQSLPRVQG